MKLQCQNDRLMLFWGYTSNFFALFSGLVLLPFIVKYFSNSELAMYFIMQTLLLVFSFLDIGFGPQLTKYTAYILSGADEIEKTGLSLKKNSSTNFDLLHVVINIAKKFYYGISFICLLMLAIVGLVYYTYSDVVINIKDEFICIWLVFSLHVFINSKYSYLLPYLNGYGFIVETKKISIISKVIQFITSVGALYFGFGLIGILISNVFSILSQVIASYFYINRYQLSWKTKSFGKERDKVIFFNMIYSAKYIGGYYISNLLLGRGSLLVGGLFLSAEMMASYGLVVQIMTLICTFSTVFSNVIQTKVLHYRMADNSKGLKIKLSNSVLSFLFLSILASIVLYIFGSDLLILIGSSANFPEKHIVLLCIIYSLLDMHYQLFNTFIATENKFPFVKTSIQSSIISLSLVFIFLFFTNSLIFLILIPLVVQIVFNFWYWPIFACRSIHDTYYNIIVKRDI